MSFEFTLNRLIQEQTLLLANENFYDIDIAPNKSFFLKVTSDPTNRMQYTPRDSTLTEYQYDYGLTTPNLIHL